MRTLLIAATVVALLQGCATGGSPPTSRVSGLDGSRVVTVPGHGNACSGVVCTGLGAQWSSATPDHALLVVYVFNDVRALNSESVNQAFVALFRTVRSLLDRRENRTRADLNGRAKGAPKAPSKVAAKYRNTATGETWSGRGLQPKWLKAAVAGGASVQDFAI